MSTFFYVFVGGGLGSISRYLISKIDLGSSLPYGTLIANVCSSFILGFLLGMSLSELLKHPHRMLLMTGFCGGFSTFSTFSAEIVQLYMDGQVMHSILYMVISLFAGVLSILLGMAVAKGVFG